MKSSPNLRTCRDMFRCATSCLLGKSQEDDDEDSEGAGTTVVNAKAKPVTKFNKPINVAVEAEPNTELHSSTNNTKSEYSSAPFKSTARKYQQELVDKADILGTKNLYAMHEETLSKIKDEQSGHVHGQAPQKTEYTNFQYKQNKKFLRLQGIA